MLFAGKMQQAGHNWEMGKAPKTPPVPNPKDNAYRLGPTAALTAENRLLQHALTGREDDRARMRTGYRIGWGG